MGHETYLRRAIELAAHHSADGRNGPFGAVVVCNGEIVGEGWNRVVELNDPTAHAEVVAIREACRRLENFVLSNCVLYSSCEPCPMCLAATYWARIPTVYYSCTREDARHAGFDDEKLYCELSLGCDEREIDSVQLLHDEGFDVLERWRLNPQKVPY